MASTSRSEADAMIEEFIRLQEAQVRLQEAQVTLLKRMLGSSPAGGTTPTKDAAGVSEEETLPVTGDSMQSGQDGRAVMPVVPTEEVGSEAESEAESEEDPLEGMHLREWCDQDPLEWEAALRSGNCKSLMTQLGKDPSLMMVTVDGRTVLHVASIYGCTPLVHQVLQNSGCNLDDREVPLSDDYIPTGFEAVYFAVDAETKLTASGINNFFVRQKYSYSAHTSDDGMNYRKHQLVEIREVINQVWLDKTNHAYVSNLIREYPIDEFDPDHIELTYHHACGRISESYYRRYVEDIIGCLSKGGGERLNCLLQSQDWRGNPPFQIPAAYNIQYYASDATIRQFFEQMIDIFKNLLRSSPDSFGVFINASDARGWTFLHKCAAQGHYHAVETLMKEESIDGNLTLPKSRATPLHLAILHNHPQVVKKLLMTKDKINLNAIFERSIAYGDKDKSGNERLKLKWTPLQLAAIMGHSDVVRELLTKVEQIHDVGKRVHNGVHNDCVPTAPCKRVKNKFHDDPVSALQHGVEWSSHMVVEQPYGGARCNHEVSALHMAAA